MFQLALAYQEVMYGLEKTLQADLTQARHRLDLGPLDISGEFHHYFLWHGNLFDPQEGIAYTWTAAGRQWFLPKIP
jgi:hypothetical protein